MHKETIQRFWSKVEKTPTCWLWTASKRYKGYGAFVWAEENGRVIQGRAHRFSWLIHRGAIPADKLVLHRCDTPSCVNPKHLFLGTHQDNVNDMIRKGRRVNGGTYQSDNYERGEDHHNAKISWEIVTQIRLDKEIMSYSQLAKKYRLSLGHLHRIIHYKAWKHHDPKGETEEGG